MKILKILLFTCFMLASGVATAQFSISTVTPGELSKRDLRDSIMPNPLVATGNYKNDFFDREFWMAEKRKLRRQRHTTEMNAALQVSQTQFKNWASGGDNTFNGRATYYFRHVYQRNKLSYEIKFEARYGLNFIEKSRFKNEDEFKINLSTAWNMNKWWSYAAAGNLRSQFSTSYKSRDDRTRVSTLMAPGFLDLQIGFQYDNKPFKVLLSPVGGDAVFVLDESLRAEGMNGVEPGKKSKWMVGPSVRMNLDYEFYKKIFWLRSDFYSFTNLKKMPTVRWETNFDIRATKFLTTTLKGIMYYDKESAAERPHTPQYTYVISVGLAYSFKSKK